MRYALHNENVSELFKQLNQKVVIHFPKIVTTSLLSKAPGWTETPLPNMLDEGTYAIKKDMCPFVFGVTGISRIYA